MKSQQKRIESLKAQEGPAIILGIKRFGLGQEEGEHKQAGKGGSKDQME